MIAAVARLLGLNTLVVWLIVALAAGGSLWGYGAYQYRAGKTEGALVEQTKWLTKMAELRAENERRRQAAQAEIDRIEAETLSQQKRAEEAEAHLEELIHDNETTAPSGGAILPKRLSDGLNAQGR